MLRRRPLRRCLLELIDAAGDSVIASFFPLAAARSRAEFPPPISPPSPATGPARRPQRRCPNRPGDRGGLAPPGPAARLHRRLCGQCAAPAQPLLGWRYSLHRLSLQRRLARGCGGLREVGAG